MELKNWNENYALMQRQVKNRHDMKMITILAQLCSNIQHHLLPARLLFLAPNTDVTMVIFMAQMDERFFLRMFTFMTQKMDE